MSPSLSFSLTGALWYSFRVQAATGGAPRPISEESDAFMLPSIVPAPPGQPVGSAVANNVEKSKQ